ncbi:MAG: URC4/urg3 family protein [Myxococcota bacterium]|nr:URC4/urg3 family protein [Myxococcota bacterium]
MERDSLLGAEARGPIDWLRSPVAIRTRCGDVLDAGLRGQLEHFEVRLDRMPAVIERVVRVTRAAYPDLRIPYHSRWNHFRAGKVDRVAAFDAEIASLPRDEQARIRFELAITSVLLDAGAGPRWSYVERSGERYERSEGLAVASYHMFLEGMFSGDRSAPMRADADGLDALEASMLAKGFQASASNPIVGLEGRAELLTRLGSAMRAAPRLFGEDRPRLGALYDHLRLKSQDGELPARRILATLLEGLGPIWPGRIELFGVNLGDVWRHPAAGGGAPTAGLVPFHKLSQWLAYSLVEPLEQAGVRVVGLDELTGLAEYRNGGLFVDDGVLAPRHAEVTERAHLPESEIVVEWRALTVALLDRVADGVRESLGLSAVQLPLCNVLEGGTWAAGREAAKERRSDGSPPVRVESDGTVF